MKVIGRHHALPAAVLLSTVCSIESAFAQFPYPRLRSTAEHSGHMSTLEAGDSTAPARAGTSPWTLWPSRADDVYDGQGRETFNRSSLAAYSDRASVYSEIVSDTFGPVRMALGTTLATAQGETRASPEPAAEATDETPSTPEAPLLINTRAQDELIQRFFGGGGNVVLSAIYPAITYRAKTVEALLHVEPRIGLDPPDVAQSTSEWMWNADLGVRAGIWLTGDQKKLKVFLDSRLSYVFSGDEFQQTAGFSDKHFSMGRISGGLVVGPITFSVTGVIFGPDEVEDALDPVTISVAFTGGQDSKR